MKWRIIFARTAEKELARLSGEMQLRLGRAIRSLENDPIPAQVKRLKGRTEFRMRVGDHRVLYTVEHENRILTILAVGHRRDVYR
jgi:mRNA interferase RelE/StbE